ncbi:hypothetical protein Bbelb_238450 [Branchiostoma belcheri]|nr:hypothetical protein Bbelb_238450 [Branchiostoma belcheri]
MRERVEQRRQVTISIPPFNGLPVAKVGPHSDHQGDLRLHKAGRPSNNTPAEREALGRCLLHSSHFSVILPPSLAGLTGGWNGVVANDALCIATGGRCLAGDVCLQTSETPGRTPRTTYADSKRCAGDRAATTSRH